MFANCLSLFLLYYSILLTLYSVSAPKVHSNMCCSLNLNYVKGKGQSRKYTMKAVYSGHIHLQSIVFTFSKCKPGNSEASS